MMLSRISRKCNRYVQNQELQFFGESRWYRPTSWDSRTPYLRCFIFYTEHMSLSPLPKEYTPGEYESSIYEQWESSGLFSPDNLPNTHQIPYTIMMPPPNVTGILHIGHAMENSLMDCMIRYQRLRGKKALLLPGTDHAAVATQARVEKNLIDSGKYKNPRQELGREGLLKEVRTYAEDQKQYILNQIKKLGTSADWDRLAYTFDEKRSHAVNALFKQMFEDGLIYSGHRVVNWSVKGQSTCSDDELEYAEREAKMFTFKYSKDFPIPIASTRPETKLGDTAVAVHPDDTRYQQYIGQTFTVAVGAAKPLSIRIIADPSVDKDLGTGALGVTPAHSQIDYELYEKRKGTDDEINLIAVIGKDGLMNSNAGIDYEGLTVEAARKKFVEYLRSNSLLESEEAITQNVGLSDRFNDIVEVLPMTQWFVAVNKQIPGKDKTLKDLMRDAVTTGHNNNSDQKVTITPERFKKVYLHWIDNLRDWCISRQIWWGHRIPVWYNLGEDEYEAFQKNPESLRGFDLTPHFSETKPTKNGNWVQDPDTLDTWFSSGAWTFSTLGWPERTSDLQTFHPTTWMQMGHELLFFWMARMILMSTYALDEIPFRDVYIHGIVRDEQGQKFSKSLGNGFDPLELTEKYGTDALRLSLLLSISPGNDMRFYEEKVEHFRNTVNKLWNIARFILMSVDEVKPIFKAPKAQTISDQWILRECNVLIADMTHDFETYNFSLAGEKLYEFTWSKFADWYIEIAKIEENKNDILLYILTQLLVLWHPFAPYVTEVLWQQFNSSDMLLIQQWPKASELEQPTEYFEKMKEIITNVRNLRTQAKEPAGKIITTYVNAQSIGNVLQTNKNVIERLARVELVVVTSPYEGQHVSCIEHDYELYIPVSDTILQALDEEKKSLQQYITNLGTKLANKNFVEKAPQHVVEQEQQKLTDAKEKLSKMI